MNKAGIEERATRRCAALVVNAGELRAAAGKLESLGLDLLSQMATFAQDGAAEYERAVNVLRQIRLVRDVREARALADRYLREI